MDLVIGAFAADGLKSLTVTVNGGQWITHTWPASPAITDTFWTTPFTPTAEGDYRLETVVEDQNGAVQTELQPVTVTVDTQPPAITLNTLALTMTHQLSLGRVRLAGTVTDTVAARSCGKVLTDTLVWNGKHSLVVAAGVTRSTWAMTRMVNFLQSTHAPVMVCVQIK